jgi:hypothetical protein
MLDLFLVICYNYNVIRKEMITMTETKELILNALGELARIYPQQRMGQIIFNYVCANFVNNDPFYIEDERLLQILEEILDNSRK